VAGPCGERDRGPRPTRPSHGVEKNRAAWATRERKKKKGWLCRLGFWPKSIVKLFFYFFQNLLSFQTPLNQYKLDLNLNGFNSILKPRTLNQLK
jgi:hypothetical protein